MEKSEAIDTAITQLNTLLSTQSALLQYEKGFSNNGDSAATFCIGFIEKYSAWLQQNK